MMITDESSLFRLEHNTKIHDSLPCVRRLQTILKIGDCRVVPELHLAPLRDVPYKPCAAHYEEAKAFGQEIKRLTLKACAEDGETTKEVYAVVEANWPLDNMDEEELEVYK